MHARAYATCEALARSHYENFPVASWLLPAPMRPHVAAVYAFARIADDITDEGTVPARERLTKLNAWQRRLHAALEVELESGTPHQHEDLIVAVRVLINGAPIAAYVSTRHAADEKQPTSFDDRPEGIARDRWDVAVETVTGLTLIECGAIRERVSQELARKVFDAIKSELERRDRT